MNEWLIDYEFKFIIYEFFVYNCDYIIFDILYIILLNGEDYV